MWFLGESYESSQAPKLPPHLAAHQRDKLLVDPEVNINLCCKLHYIKSLICFNVLTVFWLWYFPQIVIERSHMSGDFFNLYLHQNYPDFFSDVEDIARASEYLSDADFLTAEWSVSAKAIGLP